MLSNEYKVFYLIIGIQELTKNYFYIYTQILISQLKYIKMTSLITWLVKIFKVSYRSIFCSPRLLLFDPNYS